MWRLASGEIAPGGRYLYTWDDAGNPVRGGPAEGDTPRWSFTQGAGNLQARRLWGNQVEILGEAPAETSVGVSLDGGAFGRAERLGERYRYLGTVPGLDAEARDIVIEIVASHQEGTREIVQRLRGRMYLPKANESPLYDGAGQVVEDSRWEYTWNLHGQLVRAESSHRVPNVRLDYDYYPSGPMARRIRSEWMNGAWTAVVTNQWIVDGWRPIKEIERKGSTRVMRQYTWGLDFAGVRDQRSFQDAGGIGGLLAIREQTNGGTETKRYVISDPQGNVMALADASGTLVAQFDYDPFGRLIMETGEAELCPFRFSTKYRDPDLELYCFGHRWYDPAAMKWLTPDPLGERGGANLTAYCGNDPINQMDPLGLAGYFFDGTWIDKEDSNNPTVSNISRLQGNYIGTTRYREGVGCGNRTGGIRGFFTKIFGGLFGSGWDARVEWMYQELEAIYNDDSDPENKQIDIFGFSRGAGMARDFANMIKNRGVMYKGKRIYPKIRFLGVFETVACVGLPANDINLGKTLSLPDNVMNAAHALAGHEARGAFPLTLFAAGPRGEQQWFSGSHSDIGGAYNTDRVQGYISLYWMYIKAWDAGVPLGAFPREYYDEIAYYRFHHNVDWDKLWSSNRSNLAVEPLHDSTDHWIYWFDRAKMAVRRFLGLDPYQRTVYVH